MADLFSGIYGNKYKWRHRHSDSYWLKEGKLETIKSVFPEAYSWFDELIQRG